MSVFWRDSYSPIELSPVCLLEFFLCVHLENNKQIFEQKFGGQPLFRAQIRVLFQKNAVLSEYKRNFGHFISMLAFVKRLST